MGHSFDPSPGITVECRTRNVYRFCFLDIFEASSRGVGGAWPGLTGHLSYTTNSDIGLLPSLKTPQGHLPAAPLHLSWDKKGQHSERTVLVAGDYRSQ